MTTNPVSTTQDTPLPSGATGSALPLPTPGKEHSAWMRYLHNFPFYEYACGCHACQWVRDNWKHAPNTEPEYGQRDWL